MKDINIKVILKDIVFALIAVGLFVKSIILDIALAVFIGAFLVLKGAEVQNRRKKAFYITAGVVAWLSIVIRFI